MRRHGRRAAGAALLASLTSLAFGQEAPCDAAHASACRDLGIKYETGKGVARDAARAAELYRQACEAQDALGCFRLGLLYEAGNGVGEDLARAASLYEQACQGGLAQGCAYTGDMYVRGAGVAADPGKAAAFYVKACDANNAGGCHQLAALYEEGQGVEKDLARAAALYEKACQGGLGASCSSAGEMFTSGAGVPQDLARAATLYTKGCEKKDHVSCERAGQNTSVAEGLAEGRKAKASCAKVVKLLRPALFAVRPVLNDESLEAYESLERCAWQEGFFQTAAIVAAKKIVAGDRYVKSPGDLPRALMRLGSFQDADEARIELQKDHPRDPDLKTVEAWLACQKGDYPSCLDLSNEAVALALASPPAAGPHAPELRARFVRAHAYFFLTQLPEVKTEIAALDALARKLPSEQARLSQLRKDAAFAEKWGVSALWSYQEQVSLGTYHLFKNEPDAHGGSLFSLTLLNFSQGDRELRFELRIPGLTETITESAFLQKAEMKKLELTPPLRLDFDTRRVTEPRQVQLELRLTEPSASGSIVILERSLKVNLLPRNYLPLARKVAQDSERRTYENIAAWITPNTAAVEKLITAAKARAPRATFAGEQAETRPQVKAIWDELQARGMSYVMDPSVLAGEGAYQRIRLPDDVLETGNAQCLEGSILFATLLEAIGLRPLLVMVPGHAFVGWYPSEKDGVEDGSPFFLETTMVHDKPFDDALKAAAKTYREDVTPSNLKSGEAVVLDLSVLQRQGIYASPR